jgi:hypothetical protein
MYSDLYFFGKCTEMVPQDHRAVLLLFFLGIFKLLSIMVVLIYELPPTVYKGSYFLCGAETFEIHPIPFSFLLTYWAIEALLRKVSPFPVSSRGFLCFLLAVSKFLVLYQDLWYIWNWCLYQVRDRGLVSEFYIYIYNFRIILLQWHYLLSNVGFWHHYQKIDGCTYVRSFLSFLFHAIDLHVCFGGQLCALSVQYNLK